MKLNAARAVVMTATRWPSILWIVRQGERAGNVARDAAHAAGFDRIDIVGRDVDVPLSKPGEAQADALGLVRNRP